MSTTIDLINMSMIEELTNKHNELGELIKQLSDLEIDFNEFIGRDKSCLVIKGRKNLYSYKDGSLIYSNDYCNFKYRINYEYVSVKDIKKNDVFILCQSLDDIKIRNFRVCIGFNNDTNIVYQSLGFSNGIERIIEGFVNLQCVANDRCIRFLR